MIRLVCAAEKLSVDITEITTAHSSAGHHARNQLQAPDLGVSDWFRRESLEDMRFVVHFHSKRSAEVLQAKPQKMDALLLGAQTIPSGNWALPW